MRLIVTGAAGQLGRDVVHAAAAHGDEVTAVDRAELDVTDRAAVLEAVAALRPDAIVHCAAWTAVDECESDPDRAFIVNALAVRWIAEACHRTGAHLVHISTDYVFDGHKPTPYVEWDVTHPLGVYGRSKLAGEHEALALGADAAVVRTSWVCSGHGSNMVRTIAKLSAERDELTFVDDQIGHPTFTSDLAPMLRRLALERRSGVHHITNQGVVSWFEFAREVVAALGRNPLMVRPISTAQLLPPRPAQRPANSVLDNAVLRAAGLPQLPDFRETLAAVAAALRTEMG